MPTNTTFNAVVFDYLCGEFFKEINNHGINIILKRAVTKEIVDLKRDVKKQIATLSNPFWALLSDTDDFEYESEVPGDFVSEYYGYRRGSDRGDFVR